MFFPPINLPLEPTPWAKKVQAELEKEIARGDKQDRDIAALLAQLAAAARQSNAINIVANQTSDDNTVGVPMPTITGGVLRGLGPGGGPQWSYDWQGLMPQYAVHLDPAGSYYGVNGMALTSNYEADQVLSALQLPPVVFADDDMTMLPIDFGNYDDNPADMFSGRAEVPIFLQVNVYPSFDGEEFTIYLPTHTNSVGVTAPVYSFSLYGRTAFSAVVNIVDTALFYTDGTPVNGDPDVWTIPAFYQAGWFVSNVVGWGTVAQPGRYVGGGGVLYWSDPYYATNVAGMRQQFTIAKDGALTVATIPRRTYNHTVGDLVIGKVTASVGTAPSGADLTLVLKKNGSSISSAFAVAAGTNSGVATLTNTDFAVGDYLTVEVTQTGSAADLNVQIWAG